MGAPLEDKRCHTCPLALLEVAGLTQEWRKHPNSKAECSTWGTVGVKGDLVPWLGQVSVPRTEQRKFKLIFGLGRCTKPKKQGRLRAAEDM